MAAAPGSRTLVLAGALLFFAGLIQGGLVQEFLNPRMGLSAHLTAVQSGMALMITGAVWAWTDLSPRWSVIVQWSIIAGMVGLWMGLTLSAATGASESLPIAGGNYVAAPEMERIVSMIIVISSAAMTVGWLGFVIGLIRGR